MIILVGTLPPPVHGAALVTQRVKESLVAAKIPILICDTSEGRVSSRWRHHLKRLFAYIRSGASILFLDRRNAGPTAVYMCLSGGLGLIYDLAIVVLARLKRYDLIFHHHSFKYINRPSAIMGALIRAAGERQIHIALCSLMEDKLKTIYSRRLHVEVISNFSFIGELDGGRGKDGGLRAVGFLSNISFEKGIDRFFDMMAELRSRGSGLAGKVAGPFDDDDVRRYVERRLDEIGGIEYVGPVFGDTKERFLSSIDLLVFPSRYRHEAQPLVIYEAQAAGVVVAASDRGCVAQMISDGLLLDSTASEMSTIVEKILAWENTPELFSEAVRETRARRAAMADRKSVDLARVREIFSAYG